MAAGKEVKLTKPQIELLEEVRAGRGGAVDFYPPAKALVAKGLCEWKRGGGFGGDILVLTESGREWKNPKTKTNDQT